jgi:hypothetical protein
MLLAATSQQAIAQDARPVGTDTLVQEASPAMYDVGVYWEVQQAVSKFQYTRRDPVFGWNMDMGYTLSDPHVAAGLSLGFSHIKSGFYQSGVRRYPSGNLVDEIAVLDVASTVCLGLAFLRCQAQNDVLRAWVEILGGACIASSSYRAFWYHESALIAPPETGSDATWSAGAGFGIGWTLFHVPRGASREGGVSDAIPVWLMLRLRYLTGGSLSYGSTLGNAADWGGGGGDAIAYNSQGLWKIRNDLLLASLGLSCRF